jgi:hypothetical protein
VDGNKRKNYIIMFPLFEVSEEGFLEIILYLTFPFIVLMELLNQSKVHQSINDLTNLIIGSFELTKVTKGFFEIVVNSILSVYFAIYFKIF